MNSLEIIKNTNIIGDSPDDVVNNDLKSIIERITSNYSNPEAISEEKIDMTETIKKYGYSVDDYKEMFGSVMRSEKDVVDALAKRLKGSKLKQDEPETEKPNTTANDDAKAKAKKRAMALALAMEMELELLKI